MVRHARIANVDQELCDGTFVNASNPSYRANGPPLTQKMEDLSALFEGEPIHTPCILTHALSFKHSGQYRPTRASFLWRRDLPKPIPDEHQVCNELTPVAASTQLGEFGRPMARPSVATTIAPAT